LPGIDAIDPFPPQPSFTPRDWSPNGQLTVGGCRSENCGFKRKPLQALHLAPDWRSPTWSEKL
jgi:hypothetical protein